MIRPDLLKAYRQTCYQVGGIDLRIGCRSPAMDRLLTSHNAREAAFVTAYNPYSRVMPDGWNRRMQGCLAEALRRRTVLPGKGTWRKWSESHVVVFGDVRPTCRLAWRYRQYGIVITRIRQPAGLLITSSSVISS